MRVVSLVPSMTETLLAWGIEPVACTRFCEQPRLRHVGGTKDPDVAAIVALHPDLVIVDAEENRIEDHDKLVAAGISVHVLRIVGLDDVDEQLLPLAERLSAVATPVGQLPEVPVTRSAFVPIWRRPWMALGSPTYGTSVLAALGIANVFARSVEFEGEGTAGAYPEVTLADAAARGCDLVIAPSEPYPFTERHRAELAEVAPPVFLDGRDLLWWGTRTPAALARLAALLAQ